VDRRAHEGIVTVIDSLRKAERRYQRASRASEAARLAREHVIREAAQTMSTRQIAAHVSVSAQRVQQIVKAP
jgi:transposase-like protein